MAYIRALMRETAPDIPIAPKPSHEVEIWLPDTNTPNAVLLQSIAMRQMVNVAAFSNEERSVASLFPLSVKPLDQQSKISKQLEGMPSIGWGTVNLSTNQLRWRHQIRSHGTLPIERAIKLKVYELLKNTR
jgi:hypothetical protein